MSQRRSRSRSRSRPPSEERIRGPDTTNEEAGIIIYRIPPHLAHLASIISGQLQPQQQPQQLQQPRGSHRSDQQMGANQTQNSERPQDSKPQNDGNSKTDATGQTINKTKSTPFYNDEVCQDLRLAYPGNCVKHFQFLNTLRPFGGCGVDKSTEFDPHQEHPLALHLKREAYQIDVTGIDVALTLYRHLLSLHMEMIIPEDRITTEEAAFLKAAWSNICWDPSEDHQVKNDLVKQLLGVQELSKEDIQNANLTFENILHHPKLRLLIKENPHFHIASHIVLEKTIDEPDTAWKRSTVDAATLLHFNQLKWDGVSELEYFVSTRFGGTKIGNLLRSHFAARPSYFYILYEPETKFRSISEIRSFQMRGLTTKPMEEGQVEWTCDNRRHTYVIYAIVRLGNKDGLKDDIRTYTHKGTEILPQETVGGPTECNANEEYRMTGKRWSIQDKGRYMLFYYRISNKEGHPKPETFIVQDAPEFRPRKWCTDDTPMTNALGTSDPPRGNNNSAGIFSAFAAEIAAAMLPVPSGPSTEGHDRTGKNTGARLPQNAPTATSKKRERSESEASGSEGMKSNKLKPSVGTRPTSRGSGMRSNRYCNHCKKYGHPEEKCWIKNPSLRRGASGSSQRGNPGPHQPKDRGYPPNRDGHSGGGRKNVASGPGI
ncbi:hypothetical protein NHQ30_005316 [Ciborinia camelliae]|nr:hypothetical protein NHQ30_005316 [Ciborinia camelliae]